jgi:hypothetical protein
MPRKSGRLGGVAVSVVLYVNNRSIFIKANTLVAII